jgi:hypothetical protein
MDENLNEEEEKDKGPNDSVPDNNNKKNPMVLLCDLVRSNKVIKTIK